MCDPVTIALALGSTAASAVGGGMVAGEAARNNTRIAAARNKVLRETNSKNQKWADANRNVFNKNLNLTDPENTKTGLAEAQGKRGGDIEGNISTTAAEVPLSGDAPKVVSSNLAKAMASTFAKSKERAKALGALGGYGDQARDLAIADSGARSRIGVNNDFVRGNMSIMPYLQDFEEFRAYKPSSGFGQILQALGGMGSRFAGSRTTPGSIY